MSEDARFEDGGGERPLNLGAMDAEDLQVVSSLVQDAVLPANEIAFQKRHQRLGLLVNRVRWEDREAAERQGRPLERVQSVLSIENVLNVASQGIQRDSDTVLSLLSIGFEAQDDGAGFVTLTFAGDGALRASVEALELRLKDVTRPYVAPSGKAPSHPE
jgi:hypothetical protein